MTFATVPCSYCSANIDPASAYQEVVGWEAKRGQGGTNALRCRKPQQKWACASCVNADQKGRLNQEGFRWD